MESPSFSPPDPPLAAYLDHLAEELRNLTPLALIDWDDHAIHQTRVATRRLKAGVDLFRPVLSADARKRFSKVTRRLRRRLGPLRDLNVMLGHLDELSKRNRHATAVGWLIRWLRVQREAARATSREQKSPAKLLDKLDSWQGVRGEIVEAAGAIDSLLTESIHAQLEAFAKHADQLRPSSGTKRGAADASPDIHQLRIAGKALRYTLEMAGEHGRPLEPRVLRTFKRMQAALGLWHDFVVLTEWAMRASLDGLLAHHDTKLQADVLALARLTLSRAEQQLQRFSVLWANEGPRLVETIHAGFPGTQPVSRLKMDPDPPATVAPSIPAAASITDRPPV